MNEGKCPTCISLDDTTMGQDLMIEKQTAEQLALFETGKKCKNCRSRNDVRPKGYFQCVKCKQYIYAE